MSEEWIDPFWEQDSSFPEPKRGMESVRCHVCGKTQVIVRGWMHHCKPESPSPYRIDVGVKCTYCAAAWFHGVKTTIEHFRGHGAQFNRRHKQLFYDNGAGLLQRPEGVAD